MSPYRIMTHRGYKTIALKKGWSWWAFGFSTGWLLFHRIWGQGIALVILSLLFDQVLKFIPDYMINSFLHRGLFSLPTIIIEKILGMPLFVSIFSEPRMLISTYVSVFFWVIVGAKGNDLRFRNLLNRGFIHRDTVEANNPDQALALYYAKSVEQR